MKKEVDFIGIGTIKSGTSFLADLLMQHPDVLWASKKEVNYFNKFEVTGNINPYSNLPLSFYYSFFKEKNNLDIKQGEFSPIYIYDKNTLIRIKKIFPQIKVLVAIRNPVQRAYSHYWYSINFTKIIPKDISFDKALTQYPFLLELGLYSSMIRNTISTFSPENTLILTFDQLINNTAESIRSTYNFIGVSTDFSPSIKKVNESKQVKNVMLDKLYGFPGKVKNFLLEKEILSEPAFQVILKSRLYNWINYKKYNAIDKNVESFNKPRMQKETKDFLYSFYYEDVIKLEHLTGFDLAAWKNPSSET